jgi:hypothetical protein
MTYLLEDKMIQLAANVLRSSIHGTLIVQKRCHLCTSIWVSQLSCDMHRISFAGGCG